MVGGCHFQTFWMHSKLVRSIFFTFLEPGNKSENFFAGKIGFFSEIIGIFPKNRRFFAEIFLNDFSMDFSSPLQPITEKSTDFSDFLFPAWATYPRNFPASYLVSMVSSILWSPEGLVEVRVTWPGHLHYQKKKNPPFCQHM